MRLGLRWVGAGLSLAVVGCKTVPKDADPFQARVISSQVNVIDQSLTELAARVVLEVKTRPGARAMHGHVEMLVDRASVGESDVTFNAAVSDDGRVTVVLNHVGHYAKTGEDIAALEKRGKLQVTLRGTVTVESAGMTRTASFTQLREVRAPRLLVPRMVEVSAGRYDNGEVNVIFRLGITNPNPFPVRLRGVRYQTRLADTDVGDGTVGQADIVSASSSVSYELQDFLDVTQAALNRRLFRMTNIPYVVAGELAAEPYAKRFELKGVFRLTRDE